MQTGYSRREVVRVLFAATTGLIGGTYLPLEASPEVSRESLNFVMIGDWGRHGEPDQVEVAEQMALAAAKIRASFVVSVGDNFYEDGVVSTTDPHWINSFENVYHQKSLQVPWYVILGNHDYHANCEAQLQYAKISPRWIMPARYFQQSHRLPGGAMADFFYVDTTPFLQEYLSHENMVANIRSQDVPGQLKWLEKSLAASKADWKIVIGHHPIYSAGGHGDTEELVDQMLPLINQYGVQAYFNGHDHNLQHLVAGKVHFFDSGAGSRHLPVFLSTHARFIRDCSGFITVSLAAENMRVQFIDISGEMIYHANVPRIAA